MIDRHPKPDGAFAMHITPNVPTGIFTAKAGAFMASTDTIKIRVVGKGGHASTPHHTVDPMPVACEIVLALQTLRHAQDQCVRSRWC